jgi:hypothetical protein
MVPPATDGLKLCMIGQILIYHKGPSQKCCKRDWINLGIFQRACNFVYSLCYELFTLVLFIICQ